MRKKHYLIGGLLLLLSQNLCAMEQKREPFTPGIAAKSFITGEEDEHGIPTHTVHYRITKMAIKKLLEGRPSRKMKGIYKCLEEFIRLDPRIKIKVVLLWQSITYFPVKLGDVCLKPGDGELNKEEEEEERRVDCLRARLKEYSIMVQLTNITEEVEEEEEGEGKREEPKKEIISEQMKLTFSGKVSWQQIRDLFFLNILFPQIVSFAHRFEEIKAEAAEGELTDRLIELKRRTISPLEIVDEDQFLQILGTHVISIYFSGRPFLPRKLPAFNKYSPHLGLVIYFIKMPQNPTERELTNLPTIFNEHSWRERKIIKKHLTPLSTHQKKKHI